MNAVSELWVHRVIHKVDHATPVVRDDEFLRLRLLSEIVSLLLVALIGIIVVILAVIAVVVIALVVETHITAWIVLLLLLLIIGAILIEFLEASLILARSILIALLSILVSFGPHEIIFLPIIYIGHATWIVVIVVFVVEPA